MRPLLTSTQMAAADRYTIEKLGIAGLTLMERAARGCAEILLTHLDDGDAVAVIAGTGNNGGDGFAIARLLIEAGHPVDTFLACPEKTRRGAALANLKKLQAMAAPIHPIEGDFSPAADYRWLVDALFGTGLDRPARGSSANIITAINRHEARVLAVDMPSGLCGSRGAIPGEAIEADITVTFHAPKIAHAISPACTLCGELVVIDIGISDPPGLQPTAWYLAAADYQRRPRRSQSHKGSFGTLAIIGGFAGMEGAANLSGLAALRFGAGKVRIYTDQPGGRFGHDALMVAPIDAYRGGYDALVIGPGTEVSNSAMDAIANIVCGGKPVVWDAGGLHFLQRYRPTKMGAPWVMTPHPGEAAMLLDTDAQAIQADRQAAIEALAQRFPGGWILLKGYRSLIRSPNGAIYVCGSGGPSLAVAGSGDVLSGMIGALLAQGYEVRDAVLLACLRHGMAGDHWSEHHRDYSMLPEDIIADLVD